jgi:hypothetical protein
VWLGGGIASGCVPSGGEWRGWRLEDAESESVCQQGRWGKQCADKRLEDAENVALDGQIHGGNAGQEAAGESAGHVDPDVEWDAAVFLQNGGCVDAVGQQTSRAGAEAHRIEQPFLSKHQEAQKI